MSRLLLAALLIACSLFARGDDWGRQANQAVAPPINLFARQSWQPPLPPPPPPPRPVAPPLPFQYRGSLLEDGKLAIFLAQQTRQIIARQGDVIDNTYRIDAIAAQTIDFTYLPLNEKQQLSTGRSQ
jgi:hypothetical protein